VCLLWEGIQDLVHSYFSSSTWKPRANISSLKKEKTPQTDNHTLKSRRLWSNKCCSNNNNNQLKDQGRHLDKYFLTLWRKMKIWALKHCSISHCWRKATWRRWILRTPSSQWRKEPCTSKTCQCSPTMTQTTDGEVSSMAFWVLIITNTKNM
jgi:hypothetical protein